MKHNRIKHLYWVCANFYGRVFGRPLLAPLHGVFLNLSLHALGFDNCARPSFSGEEWFIREVLATESIEVAIDVGANVGNYSEKLLQNLNAKVYSVEPAALSYKVLVKLGAKFPGRAKFIQCAISDYDGEGVLSSKTERAETATLDIGAFGTVGSKEKVKVATLDSLVAELALGRVDFIKIDTEGFEDAVLRGMRNVLSTFKPKFLQLEFNKMQIKRGYNFYSLSAYLPGYDFYRLLPNGWVKIDPESFIANIYIFNNIVAKRKASV